MLKMKGLKSLVTLCLVLTIVAERREKECNGWVSIYGCQWAQEDPGRSRVHNEEWRGIPQTFQAPDEGDIPGDSKNARNTMDFEMKNGKRASGYKRFKAYLEDLDQ